MRLIGWVDRVGVAAAVVAAAAALRAEPAPSSSSPAPPEATGAAAAGDPARAHVELYRKIAPAVVAIESLGSGVLIAPDGLILSSSSGVPPRDHVMVFFADGTRRPGKVVARAPAYELALVKVDPPAGGAAYPVVSPAEGEPPLGRVVYTLGNGFQSLSRDGQVALSVGIVSGAYALGRLQGHGRASYTGRVLETTAAVNPGMSGAPVVDRDGRLVGLVTLNYDNARWLGAVIPWAVLKPAVDDLRAGRPAPPREAVAGTGAAAGEDGSGGWLGVEVDDAADGGVTISRVEKNSPAEKIDLHAGDRITALDDEPVEDKADFEEAVSRVAAGARLRLTLQREGRELRKVVELEKPPAGGAEKKP